MAGDGVRGGDRRVPDRPAGQGRDRRRAGRRRRGRPRADDRPGSRRPARRPLLDTCGTGGDGASTVNVSTATALVVAACGVPVAKHGNRSASGNSGSAEVLAELGVAVEADPPSSAAAWPSWASRSCSPPGSTRPCGSLAPVRRQLPFRTLFNLVGPLANPARPAFQLVGVAGRAPGRPGGRRPRPPRDPPRRGRHRRRRARRGHARRPDRRSAGSSQGDGHVRRSGTSRNSACRPSGPTTSASPARPRARRG